MGFPTYTPTAPHFIKSLTDRYPDNPMIVLGESRLCYADVCSASKTMAAGLLAAGVRKGTHVGVLFPNGPDWVTCWLAITRIGAIAVPFNTFQQSRELAWTLEHADIEVFISTARFLNHVYLDRLEAALPQLRESRSPQLELVSHPNLRSIYIAGTCERTWATPINDLRTSGAANARDDFAQVEAAEALVTPADPMTILYTSGSTGDPKGAVHCHGAVISHSHNLLTTRNLVASDRVWSPMPFFWVGGLVFSLLGCMHTGACLVCEEVFDPEQTLRLLESERITVAAGWPHFGQALAKHPSRKERDLRALREGNLPEILPESIVPLDPELRPNALGMTETCGPHTCVNSGPLPLRLRGSHGVPVEGVEHKIVDPESGRRLPPGEVGEICVRGYNLMQRLHKVKLEESFDREGYYHTGDAGSFDDEGVLYFKSRLGDMIKTAGANVTPSEVEQAINALEGVELAYVVGLPDPDRGQVVAAAVVLDKDAKVDADALRARLRSELSTYKIPRRIFFKSKADLPFTESGKIDKKKLASALLAES